ncbi:DNA-binding protein [Spirochaetia bacterium]|nr:DNA-binding protein [Spirochaetia bacterium]
MNANAFIDTNIFIYTQRTDAPQKTAIAKETIRFFECFASTQVFNEICNILTKKYPTPVDEIDTFLQDIRNSCAIALITEERISEALALHDRLHFSYYDSLMIASALSCNCEYLISEDADSFSPNMVL